MTDTGIFAQGTCRTCGTTVSGIVDRGNQMQGACPNCGIRPFLMNIDKTLHGDTIMNWPVPSTKIAAATLSEDTVKPNPFALLVRSRKFWLAMLDVTVSTSLYFVGKYATLAIEDVKFLVLTLQPVFVTIIGAIAYEDAAKASAGEVA